MGLSFFPSALAKDAWADALRVTDGAYMSKTYNPNREGWGFASVVCIITAAMAFTAYTIHTNTYRHPRDPMAKQVYHERDAANAADASHGGGH